MKLLPSRTCCGCLSVQSGVEVICLLTILVSIWLIAICSSQESIRLQGVVVSPTLQVLAASWGFVGIALSINAGVGAFFRIEAPLKAFFWYQVASCMLGMVIPCWFLISGSLCETVVDSNVRRLGSGFVCGFADTFFFVWLVIVGGIHAYLVYIVWSAGEEICRNPFPELERYRLALKGARAPAPPRQHPLAQNRAVPGATLFQAMPFVGAPVHTVDAPAAAPPMGAAAVPCPGRLQPTAYGSVPTTFSMPVSQPSAYLEPVASGLVRM
mmetsp:Transcript_88343/g.248849  ORF Transcript_88343/g.248849 Transcript_88343/m.248849 type:complete len:269 (+) Transcript_88343:47-853(+)